MGLVAFMGVKKILRIKKRMKKKEEGKKEIPLSLPKAGEDTL